MLSSKGLSFCDALCGQSSSLGVAFLTMVPISVPNNFHGINLPLITVTTAIARPFSFTISTSLAIFTIPVCIFRVLPVTPVHFIVNRLYFTVYLGTMHGASWIETRGDWNDQEGLGE